MEKRIIDFFTNSFMGIKQVIITIRHFRLLIGFVFNLKNKFTLNYFEKKLVYLWIKMFDEDLYLYSNNVNMLTKNLTDAFEWL